MTWQVKAAGCPCTIRAEEGEWVVVFQAFFQSSEKVAAIIRDAGGVTAATWVVITEAINSPDEF